MDKFRSLPFTTRLFLLALVLRLIPVLAAIQLPIGLDDMFQYDMLARSLAAGEGFRWYSQEDLDLVRSYIDVDFQMDGYDPRGILSSFRAPAYPAFLAVIYSIGGLEWRFFAARLGNALLGATLAPMSYLLSKRVFPKNDPAARFAGSALAFYPLLVIYPLALATENLFIPLVLLGTLVLLRSAESRRGRDFLFAGAVFGLATLTRSVIFAFVGLAALWIWFAVRSKRGALLFSLGVLTLITPWVMRNSLLHGRFTFIETALGYNLHMGYHPQGTGTFQYGISLELIPYLDDKERDDVGIQAGLGFIRDDPGRVPYLMVRKLGYFFALERRALTYFYSNNFFGYIPAPLLLAILLIFALPFVFISTLSAAFLPFMQRTKERILLLLLLGGYLLPHVLLLSEERFHLAIVPVLAVFAGSSWQKLTAARHASSSLRSASASTRSMRYRAALAFILVGLLWLNWGMELWRDADKLALLFGPEGNVAGFPY
ncbi:MAG: glycosyltransferase family 39 protein [Anaerolineales bacterium]